MINQKAILIALLALFSMKVCAQQKFDPILLESPKSNGIAIAAKLNTIEVEEYQKPDSNCVFLVNGFRQATFTNAEDWLSIRDSVDVLRVDVVYSKYPMLGGIYSEIYPLLFNRIKATLAMDSTLNSTSLTWNKILQTHCENNAQVGSLFHGVVIWYQPRIPIKKVIKTVVDPMTEEEVIADRMERLKRLNEERERIRNEHEEFEEVNTNVDFILKSPHLPDSIKERIAEKPLDEQIETLSTYFKTIDFENEPNDELSYLYYLNEVNQFLQDFPRVQPVILKVLDRHPEWGNKIIINDWTGSMYGYGAQVFEWHLMNLTNSGISTITLFNDGDQKKTKRKEIGSTGGIYTEKTEELAGLLALFETVMQNGGGGDGPENDIEAILEAINNQPESSEIILIADNSACVRDIELAGRIPRPVRIILCGYDPAVGVNPHYVYLAKKTGGGIYTIDNDFEELKAEIGENGAITSFEDLRIKLTAPQCFNGDILRVNSINYTLKTSRFKSKKVRILNMSNEELKAIPNRVFKMENLQVLNASNNQLNVVSEDIQKLHYLSNLNLSKNALTTLPNSITNLPFIEYIDISENQLKEVPRELYALKFLKTVDLSFNTIQEIDRFESRYLQDLNLSNNQLKDIPSFRKNVEIYSLNLSGNQFKQAPTELPNSLRKLDLSNNQLTSLPMDLTSYADLEVLILTGNDFSLVEQERIRAMLFYTDLQF